MPPVGISSFGGKTLLVALRQGQGNIELAAELLKTVFLSYLLADADQRASTGKDFIHADRALKTVLINAVDTKEWRLSSQLCHSLEKIILLYDVQLASVPLHRIIATKERLSRILGTGEFPTLDGKG